MRKFAILSATALGLTLAAPLSAALAQQSQGQQPKGQQQQQTQAQGQKQGQQQGMSDVKVIALNEWNYDDLYKSGWRADRLMDANVFGPTGEEIGEVENILVDRNGKIVAIIAEVGGFWDIGDTHVAVPWDQVKISGNFERVTIPITEETAEDYSLYGPQGYFSLTEADQVQTVEDDLRTGPRVWKVSDLLNDYVTTRDGRGYGYVDDVVFDKNGEVKAVVVNPDVGYGVTGPFAYPYYGYEYGWRPGFDRYELPYEENELANLDRFDFDAMNEEGLFE